MSGKYLDLSNGEEPQRFQPQPRPFIGMRFTCCAVYTRIYRNSQASAYEGRCPKCARPIVVRIGHGGTGARFFETG